MVNAVMIRLGFLSTMALTMSQAWSLPANAAIFVYRMSGVPINAAGTCDELAFQVGQRLAALTTEGAPIRVTDARCNQNDFPDFKKAWSISITYEALARLNDVSTLDPLSIKNPGYDTRTDCESVLDQEKTLFETKTGLKSFAAYCRVPYNNSTPWIISVNGFGHPAVRPFSSSVQLFGEILDHSSSSFTDLVRQQLTKANAELVQMTIRGGGMNRILSLRYYGVKRIVLEETVLATYQTAAVCAQDLSTAVAALDEANAINIGTYCQQVFMGPNFEMVSLTNQKENLGLSSTGTPYASFSDCQIAIDGALDFYRTHLGRNVKAMLCSYSKNAGSFEMKVIEQAPFTGSASLVGKGSNFRKRR
ncbi:MAG: hypothetical protein NTV34_12670 [Proteobacteria bacterium]|nr:hypothetical protein [Pseudomonadota bacterium]